MNQSTPGPTVGDILDQVAVELAKAMQKHAPMPSCHHGHSVILEELEDLFDEIKANRGNLGPAKREAIQIAAVAVRYVLDLCQPEPVAVMTHEDGERIRDMQNKRDAESNERFRNLSPFPAFDTPIVQLEPAPTPQQLAERERTAPAFYCVTCRIRKVSRAGIECDNCAPF